MLPYDSPLKTSEILYLYLCQSLFFNKAADSGIGVVFLMFSREGGSKGNIRKKWVNLNIDSVKLHIMPLPLKDIPCKRGYDIRR